MEMSARAEPAAAPCKFRDRFGSVLMAYDDEMTWLAAVKDLQDKDGDFAARVS